MDLAKRNTLVRRIDPEAFDEEAADARNQAFADTLNDMIAGVGNAGDDGTYGDPPLLTVGEFFDGNTDEQSLAPNRDVAAVPLSLVADTLRAVEARADVEAVRLTVHETPNPLVPEEDDVWIAAGEALIFSDAPREEVESWVAPLKPTCVINGDDAGEEAASRRRAAGSPGAAMHRVIWD